MISKNDKNTATEQESRGGQWPRRLVPIVVLCGGLGAALFAGTRVSHNAVPAPADTAGAPAIEVAAKPAPVTIAEKPLTREFQPSQFPGVMVRHIPDYEGSKTGSQARWYLKPGAKRSVSAGAGSYDPPAAGTIKRVTLGGGKGVSRVIPPSYRMMDEVHIVNGHVVEGHGKSRGR